MTITWHECGRQMWISTPKSFLTTIFYNCAIKFQLLHVLKTWKTKLNSMTQHFVVSFSVKTSLYWITSIGNFEKRHSILWSNREGKEHLYDRRILSPRNRVEKWVVVVPFIPPRHFFPIHRCQNYLRDKNCLRSLSPRYTRRLIREKKRRENRIERKTQLQRATGG